MNQAAIRELRADLGRFRLCRWHKMGLAGLMWGPRRLLGIRGQHWRMHGTHVAGNWVVPHPETTQDAPMTDTLQSPRDLTTGPDTAAAYTFDSRIAALQATKMAQTTLNQEVIGAMDSDDWPMVLPPEDRRELVQSISGSGMPINDVLLTGVDIQSNHENGCFYGPELCGANFRRLLEAHPPYVDVMSSLACSYMTNFGSYRSTGWDPTNSRTR